MRWLFILGLLACGYTAHAQNDTIYLDSTAIGQYTVDESKLDWQTEVQNLKEVSSAFVYPPKAKEAAFAGKLVFRVLVDTSGKVAAYEVLRSPHHWLTEAFLELLPKFKYSSPIQYGVKVQAWCLLIFNAQFE